MSTLCGMPYEDNDDYDSLSAGLWTEKRVNARKEHRCCECGGTIRRGESYGRATDLVDGSWQTWKRCPACLILAEQIATLTGECPLWGALDLSAESCNDRFSEYDEKRDEYVPAVLGPHENRRKWEATP